MAKAFIRAYKKTRAYMNDAPAAEIARAEKPYFPDTDESVLADCIATYQRLGCWSGMWKSRMQLMKNAGCLRIQWTLKQRYRYEQVCAAPPAAD